MGFITDDKFALPVIIDVAQSHAAIAALLLCEDAPAINCKSSEMTIVGPSRVAGPVPGAGNRVIADQHRRKPIFLQHAKPYTHVGTYT